MVYGTVLRFLLAAMHQSSQYSINLRKHFVIPIGIIISFCLTGLKLKRFSAFSITEPIETSSIWKHKNAHDMCLTCHWTDMLLNRFRLICKFTTFNYKESRNYCWKNDMHERNIITNEWKKCKDELPIFSLDHWWNPLPLLWKDLVQAI